jgi:hypothetical protein
VKIGIKIDRRRNGTVIVKGIERDGIAAAADFVVDDEITHIGRTPIKKIHCDENNPLEFRRGQTVKVLRAGESVRLKIPLREKPSLKFTKIARAIETADINQVEGLARQFWSCDDLSDGEKAKLGVAADRRRRALRGAQERELPLAESPAVGVGPTGNRYHDLEHWRRQTADDRDLSPLARRIVDIVAAKYIHTTAGPKYFCAWPSIKTLRRALKCRRNDVVKAIHEIEARGHWELVPQGGRKSTLYALILKPSERAPVLSSPAPTSALPDLEEESATIETASIEAVAETDSTAIDAFRTAAAAAGAAISIRRAPLGPVPPAAFVPTWSGPTYPPSGVAVSLSRRAYVEPTGSKVTRESEAKRITEAEQREADAAALERYDAFIESCYANQARSEPRFEWEEWRGFENGR